MNKCKYLFYEIKEDEGQDGGYKIDVSHEERTEMDGDFCGLGR